MFSLISSITQQQQQQLHKQPIASQSTSPIKKPPQTCIVPCSLFSFLKVLMLRLALSHISSNLQHNSEQHHSAAVPLQATNQSIHPHQKTSCPPSASLLYPVVNKEVEQQISGEGHDIVTRETFVPTSFSEHLQLRKSSCTAFCLLALFCGWGCAKLSL
jgi:hypothetical protein